MKTLLVFGLLSLILTQAPGNPQNAPQNVAALEVLSLNVKERVVNPSVDGPGDLDPPSSVTNPNPNTGRPSNRVESETERLERQTNLRVQNMHAIENQKREGATKPSVLRLYESEAAMKNGSDKAIAGFLWAYQASDALQYTQDQEFLCDTKIAAGETKRIKVVSLYPTQRIVNASSKGATAAPVKPAIKDVIINEIRFADGTIWRRASWNQLIISPQALSSVPKGKCVAL